MLALQHGQLLPESKIFPGAGFRAIASSD